jgi:hypothetical protein
MNELSNIKCIKFIFKKRKYVLVKDFVEISKKDLQLWKPKIMRIHWHFEKIKQWLTWSYRAELDGLDTWNILGRRENKKQTQSETVIRRNAFGNLGGQYKLVLHESVRCILYYFIQWLCSPFVGPWPLLQFRNHVYTGVGTPWTSDQPVARPLPTHRTTQTQNKRTHRHPWLESD